MDSSEKDFRKSDVRGKCSFANHYEHLLRNGHYVRVEKTMEANRPKDPGSTREQLTPAPHINHLECSEVGGGTMLHASILSPVGGRGTGGG